MLNPPSQNRPTASPIKLSANLSMLFTELPFLQRFAAARLAGFTAVEMQFPYAYAADDVAHALRDAGLVCVLFNLPAGDWAAGERGIACFENRQSEFRHSVEQALDYAAALNCEQLNCLVGCVGLAPVAVQNDAVAVGTARAGAALVDTVRDDTARDYAARADTTQSDMGQFGTAYIDAVLLKNLDFAARALGERNRRLLIEPINKFDVPDFYLNTAEQGLEMIKQLQQNNVFLQYDIYHAARMQEDWASVLREHQGQIAHIQIADAPGRHEPGTGQTDFAKLFAVLAETGYSGWVGCEYLPASSTEAGLRWRQSYAALI